MSFIAKNPLTIPEVNSSPSVPPTGTRGFVAGKDGWYDIDSLGEMRKIATNEYVNEVIRSMLQKTIVKTTEISLLASEWVSDSDNQHSQTVSIADVTEYSKIDLQPTVEQLVIFHEKDITFVTENENGVVTIYCVGQKPQNDYVMQATITEVVL